jgi:hypothetical protein
LYTGRIVEDSQHNYSVVVDELKFTRPVQVQGQLALTGSVSPEATHHADGSFNYLDIVKATDKHDFTAKYGADVDFKQESSTRFVPTSVKLALVSEGTMEAQLSQTLREWSKPAPSSQARKLFPIFGAEAKILDRGTKQQLVSIVSLDDRINAIHDEGFPITKKLNGPGFAQSDTKLSRITVNINADGKGEIGYEGQAQGPATKSSPFTIQILRGKDAMQEFAFPATAGNRMMSFITVNKKLPIQLEKDTLDWLFSTNQIRVRPPDARNNHAN